MLRGFFGNLIFAIIVQMLCGNHLKPFDAHTDPVIKEFQIIPIIIDNK